MSKTPEELAEEYATWLLEEGKQVLTFTRNQIKLMNAYTKGRFQGFIAGFNAAIKAIKEELEP